MKRIIIEIEDDDAACLIEMVVKHAVRFSSETIAPPTPDKEPPKSPIEGPPVRYIKKEKKEQLRATILEFIKNKGPQTRVGLAHALGVNIAPVSAATKVLIDEDKLEWGAYGTLRLSESIPI